MLCTFTTKAIYPTLDLMQRGEGGGLLFLKCKDPLGDLSLNVLIKDEERWYLELSSPTQYNGQPNATR